MNDELKYVTQDQCQERRVKIKDDYDNLKKRVDNHGKEIDRLNDSDIRTEEHIKSIEKTFGVLSKIMISVVAAIVLLIIKGALKI